MFRVEEIWDESKKVTGTCNEPTFFRLLTDAFAIIANKMDLDIGRGVLDICTTGGDCVTLPSEVQTVLGVLIGGHPTLGLDQLFAFHLNGSGENCCGSCNYTWTDAGGYHSVYRDIVEPVKLVAYLERAEDAGKKLIVFGFDDAGNRLRHQISGEWHDGYAIPTIFGYALPDSGMPNIARITGVYKDKTAGNVRLSSIDDSGATGTLLGVFLPDETLPQYRRIKLSRNCGWVRVIYRRANPTLSSRSDHIPLQSRTAFLLALRALKGYHDMDIGLAQTFEANAARLELEAQNAATPPTYMPPQILDWNHPNDKSDYDIR